MPAHQGLSAAFGGPPLQAEEYVTTKTTGCSELLTFRRRSDCCLQEQRPLHRVNSLGTQSALWG
jgi:hypothetical protein